MPSEEKLHLWLKAADCCRGEGSNRKVIFMRIEMEGAFKNRTSMCKLYCVSTKWCGVVESPSLALVVV